MTQKIKFLTVVLSALLLVSCGNGNKNEVPVADLIAEGDLGKLRERRDALNVNQQDLTSQIQSLDAAIQKLEPDQGALITTLTVNDTLFKHYIEIQGDVKTDQNVIVYPEYQGTLTRVYVKEGQRVRKGQILGKIDDGGLSSQLSQLEVQAQLAKTTFERQKRLWDQKIGSEIQYLQAKTNYESSENAVNQLKQQLAKTNVTAPFSGIVDEVITDQGTVVGPGQGLFRVVNLGDMFIEAQIPERYLTTVTEGKDVEIFFPVLGKTVSSKVKQTGNYINPDNRTFRIEVSVPEDADVKPNLNARLKINDYTAENAILIPLNVISEDADGEQYVYTVVPKEDGNGDIAIRKNIETGLTQGDIVEIKSGLELNDALVIEGARTVQDNQKVKILENR
ncbi:efflux RND transporter periplasmic adaptor subunit [Gilvibacter sediminis]|uniref:efflux RND transporter periplasmic adaptor subunit n=1 Tax=Gilvibacter sediminis TaxID=379071 RepID=UPI002350B183|nr:efflux RND transporter periplasmic adaptor subunit [Gilvibacter sediminis]MDC7996495.1 efflux RND transporter periplasmic adaptor subunit [Gilvibacter sediminis]